MRCRTDQIKTRSYTKLVACQKDNVPKDGDFSLCSKHTKSKHKREKKNNKMVDRSQDMRFIHYYSARNMKRGFFACDSKQRERERERGTWRQRSQVKGKKSICLQISTEQCFPRSGNSGVPIASDTKRERQLLTIPTITEKNPTKKKNLIPKVYQAREKRVIRIRGFRISRNFGE